MFDPQYDPGYQPGAGYPRQLTQNQAILARLAGPQTYPETIIPGVENQYQPGAGFPRQMQPQIPAFGQAQPSPTPYSPERIAENQRILSGQGSFMDSMNAMLRYLFTGR